MKRPARHIPAAYRWRAYDNMRKRAKALTREVQRVRHRRVREESLRQKQDRAALMAHYNEALTRLTEQFETVTKRTLKVESSLSCDPMRFTVRICVDVDAQVWVGQENALYQTLLRELAKNLALKLGLKMREGQ